MKLVWDQTGQRFYETGVDHGVLYRTDVNGDYSTGVAWNGLTSLTEAPSGAESNPQYADNIKYLNLVSAEEFNATLEAFTYPDEFEECDGTAIVNGVRIGQQTRKTFGLSYRTLIGNDIDQTDKGYKIHLVYGALAAPSEKAYSTVNDSPEAMTLSWEISTTPVAVGEVAGVTYKPTASLTISSLDHDAASMAALEAVLYGTEGADPRLPLPAEVISMFDGALVEVTTVAPTYDPGTDMITIPTVTGVIYEINGEPVTGSYGPITETTVVHAVPAAGYKFSPTSDNDWTVDFS